MDTATYSYRSHASALVRLGAPLAGTHLAGFLVHVTDTVMMGWYGVHELAAVVLGGTFWFVLFIMGSGFGSALPPLVAAAISSKDERQVRRLTRMAIWLTLIFCAVVAPIFFFARPILLATGQDPEVARLAGDYLLIAGWSIVPGLIVMIFRAYLSTLGRPGVILAITIVAFFLHIGLNWVLIFGNLGFPELGIRGAAISTLLTDTAILLAMGIYALRKFPEHSLLTRFWNPDWEAFGHVFALGWPISLQLLAEVGLFAGAAVLMGQISPITLAAHGIALQLASFTFLMHLGLANAATIRAGHAVGARDQIALWRGGLTAVLLSVGMAMIASAVFVAFAPDLLGLFLDPADPDTPAVIVVGVTLVYVAALFQLADGGQAMAIGLLRGVQDTRVPMVIAIVGYWVIGLPVAYALGFGLNWGGVGVWVGLVAALVFVWIALSLRFWGVVVRRAA